MGRACDDGHLRGGLGVAAPNVRNAVPNVCNRGAVFSTVRGPEFPADDAAVVNADRGAVFDAHRASLRSADVRDLAANWLADDAALVDPDGPADFGALINTDVGAVGGPHHVAVPDGRAERIADVVSVVPAIFGADGRTERGACLLYTSPSPRD